MTNSITILIAYCVATACYVLFHFNVIHTHRIDALNGTAAFVVSFSLFFVIPIAGLIHVSVLRLNRQAFRRVLKRSLVIGLAGPLLLHLMILASSDGEAQMGYLLIPVAYLASCMIGYIVLLVWCLLRSKTA